MSFLIFFLCGVLGGILGGMGMGGGTALIPLLTILCGVEAFALTIHAKSGLLKKEGILPIILPALAFSALGSLLAAYLPSAALGKGFGVFLIILSFFQFKAAFPNKNTKAKE